MSRKLKNLAPDENKTNEELQKEHRESLIKDIMWWISDKDFEPPFPYNVLYPKRDERDFPYRIGVIKEAVDRLYERAMNEMN